MGAQTCADDVGARERLEMDWEKGRWARASVDALTCAHGVGARKIGWTCVGEGPVGCGRRGCKGKVGNGWREGLVGTDVCGQCGCNGKVGNG